jgi:hypothetical protein
MMFNAKILFLIYIKVHRCVIDAALDVTIADVGRKLFCWDSLRSLVGDMQFKIDGDTHIQEQLVKLFERAVLRLWKEAKGPDKGDHGQSSEDEANLCCL